MRGSAASSPAPASSALHIRDHSPTRRRCGRETRLSPRAPTPCSIDTRICATAPPSPPRALATSRLSPARSGASGCGLNRIPTDPRWMSRSSARPSARSNRWSEDPETGPNASTSPQFRYVKYGGIAADTQIHRGDYMQGTGLNRTVRGSRTRMRGFTLVELLVVMVIVAILFAVAVPSYSYFMRKSRRSDTEATMMDIAQREAQYLNDNRAYAPDTGTLYTGVAGVNVGVPGDVTAFYTI